VIFIRRSQSAIRGFPFEVRKAIGWQLQKVQAGQESDDWKPMSIIGVGVKEIRIHKLNEYRVIYVEKFSEAIYVLHAFEKKTSRMSRINVQIARMAYAEIKKN
jgi:phage-related protein